MLLKSRWAGGALAAVALAVACSGPRADETPSARPAPIAIDRERARVVVLGDSLTAGYGLPVEQSMPAMLQQLAETAGYDVEVVNAGVSGDTTAGGLRRLDWSLQGDVRVLIVALGGNDALRGLSVDQMRTNLSSIIEQAQARQIGVLLAGMEAPPNFGPDYTSRFRGVFVDLARTHRVVHVPFLLEGVAGRPDLNQHDGIHPNAEGAARVAEHLWAALQPMLDDAGLR